MNEPQLSVLIPVWNGAREIHLLLDALAAQTLDSEHFEVVVVDNGSTDCTAEIVGRYAFVRLLSEHRPGSYSARNTGLKVLRGTYVTFTDADCVPEPTWLQNALAAVKAHPEAGVVAGRVDLFRVSPEDSVVCEAFDRLFNLNQKRYAADGHSATANWTSPLQLIRDLGGFDGDLKSGGDFDLSGRICAAGYPIIYADNVVVKHPVRGQISDLLSKRRRTIGGQWKLAQGQKSFVRFAARMVRDALREAERVIREGPDDLAMRIKLVGTVALILIAGLSELVRLRLGGTARRA